MGGNNHHADMVKWLSSEVSNLMSWVRLPLSALFSPREVPPIGFLQLDEESWPHRMNITQQ